ncbi:putative IMV membrane protein [Equine parapoxvirus]|nr:putative IMV membrane protein [Equine parapoxvirus]WOC29308.1 putative IMV membrane protein [Equine parapoxvirus]
MDGRDVGTVIGVTLLALTMVVLSIGTIGRRSAPALGIRSRNAMRALAVMDLLALVLTIPGTIVLYAVCVNAIFTRTARTENVHAL